MYRFVTVAVLMLGLVTGIAGWAQPAAANGNHAPVYNGGLANQNYNRNHIFSYRFSCACFSDPDSDHLTYTAALTDSNPLPAWLHFDGPSRTFAGTTENATGTFNIRVTATDTHAATATGDFNIQVQGGSPQFNTPMPNQAVKEGVPFSYTVAAGTFSDPDGDPLSFTCQVKKAKPDWLNIDEASLHFWGTPTSVGTSWKVIITASDGIDGTVNAEYLLSRVANLPPAYNGGIADQVWTAGHPYLYQFGAGCFSDPEGDPVTYTVLLADGRTLADVYPWIHFDGPTRTFSGTTGNDLNEVIRILIQASDPTSSTAVRFNITVLSDYHVTASTGAYGAISPPGTTYVLTGGSLSYTITPEECYSIADVLVDNVSVGAVGSYTFNNITACHTIDASFTSIYIGSVAPATGIQGQSLTVTISGANLAGATSVSFGPGIAVTGFTVNSNTQVTANITIAAGATPGTRSVSVTTAGGTGTLPNSFTVNQPTQQVNTCAGVATFTTNQGSVTGLTAIDENNLPATSKPAGVSFPYGFFIFNITNIAPGSTVTITITLPSALPAGSQYWKLQNGNWVDMTPYLGSNDGDNIITLTLIDGGPGDADGAANGTISDPGAPGTRLIVVSSPSHKLPSPSTSHSSTASITPPSQPVSLPNLVVSNASLSTTTVTPGIPFTVTACVTNISAVNGATRVRLYINGQIEAEQGITVASGKQAHVSFTLSRNEPGTYQVYVNNIPAGSFTVEAVKASDILLYASLACIFSSLVLAAVYARKRRC